MVLLITSTLPSVPLVYTGSLRWYFSSELRLPTRVDTMPVGRNHRRTHWASRSVTYSTRPSRLTVRSAGFLSGIDIPRRVRFAATVYTPGCAPPSRSSATARNWALPVSATKSMLSSELAATLMGRVKLALSPGPSLKPFAWLPAMVRVWPEARATLRMQLLPVSATYSVSPPCDKQIPRGNEKRALSPTPSLMPRVPPARVSTWPVAMWIRRMREFHVSATNSAPPS
mmetsp:Transcript_39464/g.75613  ORF Transcript_39464/g.75613 Transcript_39464/m.75613 type:complete len:228 (+) Transcript_39464:1558-2241(+)